MSRFTLYNGNCLDALENIPDGTIDALITDPPFGVTEAAWDVKPDIPHFFREAWRVLKENGPLIIFGTMKSAMEWIPESRKEFRYDLIWEKRLAAGFLDAKKKPLRGHELILVFYRKLPTYNPQMTQGKPYKRKQGKATEIYSLKKAYRTDNLNGLRYPKSVINAPDERLCFRDVRTYHSTQKPVALMTWLVRTYSNAGEMILDPFMGSGSTGVAALREGRRFIGMELQAKYYEIAETRLNAEPPTP